MTSPMLLIPIAWMRIQPLLVSLTLFRSVMTPLLQTNACCVRYPGGGYAEAVPTTSPESLMPMAVEEAYSGSGASMKPRFDIPPFAQRKATFPPAPFRLDEPTTAPALLIALASEK